MPSVNGTTTAAIGGLTKGNEKSKMNKWATKNHRYNLAVSRLSPIGIPLETSGHFLFYPSSGTVDEGIFMSKTAMTQGGCNESKGKNNSARGQIFTPSERKNPDLAFASFGKTLWKSFVVIDV